MADQGTHWTRAQSPASTEPCVKVNTFSGETHISGKMLTFQKILGHSQAKKLCAQVPIWF